MANDLRDRLAERLETLLGETWCDQCYPSEWARTAVDAVLALLTPEVLDRASECFVADHKGVIADQAAELAALRARAEHAEKAAVVNRERGEQWRHERDERRRQLAQILGIDPCTDWGDMLDQVNEIRRERDALKTELAETQRVLDNYKTWRKTHERNYQRVVDQLYASCTCDHNPETTDGPEEDCPVHGADEHRPLALKAAIERVQEAHASCLFCLMGLSCRIAAALAGGGE